MKRSYSKAEMNCPAIAGKALGLLTAKRVLVYAVTLAVITNATIVAVYIYVPAFRAHPGADFVQFYAAAVLAREAPAKVYDVEAQKEMQRRFRGAGREVYWPYLHAPFFTMLLIPLGWFSYAGAFWLWSALTILLCLASVVALWRIDSSRAPRLGLALALAYAAPVLYWLLATGQTTAIALAVWTVAFVLMRQRRDFWSGFVLGFLCYRAQYLAVIVPLLLVRCRWSALVGIAASCLLLIVAGGWFYSFDAYWKYVDAVLTQSQRILTLQQPLMHYITLYGFFRPFLSHGAALVSTVLAALPLIYWLVKSWCGRPLREAKHFELQWALAMTATLLLMHHGFVYDLLLLHVPLLLLYPHRALLPRYYKFLLLVLYFMPYVLLIVAAELPINPIQVILYWLCWQIYRVINSA
jgi:hypothetical protein